MISVPTESISVRKLNCGMFEEVSERKQSDCPKAGSCTVENTGAATGRPTGTDLLRSCADAEDCLTGKHGATQFFVEDKSTPSTEPQKIPTPNNNFFTLEAQVRAKRGM
jgi:hypothetical protein